MLERVEPDRDRFADEVTEPTLVESGPEARRTERAFLPAGEVIV